MLAMFTFFRSFTQKYLDDLSSMALLRFYQHRKLLDLSYQNSYSINCSFLSQSFTFLVPLNFFSHKQIWFKSIFCGQTVSRTLIYFLGENGGRGGGVIFTKIYPLQTRICPEEYIWSVHIPLPHVKVNLKLIWYKTTNRGHVLLSEVLVSGLFL